MHGPAGAHPITQSSCPRPGRGLIAAFMSSTESQSDSESSSSDDDIVDLGTPAGQRKLNIRLLRHAIKSVDLDDPQAIDHAHATDRQAHAWDLGCHPVRV